MNIKNMLNLSIHAKKWPLPDLNALNHVAKAKRRTELLLATQTQWDMPTNVKILINYLSLTKIFTIHM